MIRVRTATRTPPRSLKEKALGHETTRPCPSRSERRAGRSIRRADHLFGADYEQASDYELNASRRPCTRLRRAPPVLSSTEGARPQESCRRLRASPLDFPHPLRVLERH